MKRSSGNGGRHGTLADPGGRTEFKRERVSTKAQGSYSRPGGGPTLLTLPTAATDSGAVPATLTATNGTYADADTVTGAWFRNGVATGVTTLTYAITLGGSYVWRETAVNTEGSTVTDTAPVAVIGVPENTSAPSLSGTAQVGETLTCDPGAWTYSPSFAYAWFRGAAQIAGANTSTYVLVSADAGELITCRVTATNVAGSDNATTAALGPVTEAPANTVAPSVTGTPTEGETLTCAPGTWTGTPMPTFTYQWRRDTVAVSGATATTYVLAVADVGASIDCVVTATNVAGSANQASNSVGPVASGAFSPSDITSLEGWWDFSQATYSAGDLSSLPDLATLAATIGGTPEEVFINSLSAAEFGVGDTLTFTPIAANYDETWIALVIDTRSRSSQRTWNDGGDVARAHVGFTDGKVYTRFQAGFSISTTVFTENALLCVIARNSAVELAEDLRVNTVLEATRANGSGDATAAIEFGSLDVYRLGEVCWGEGHLSDADRLTLETYLMDKWGARAIPIITPDPFITGTPQVGETLTANPQSPGYQYEWFRDGSLILGATSSTYVLVSADLGALITCRLAAEVADKPPAIDTARNAAEYPHAAAVEYAALVTESAGTPVEDINGTYNPLTKLNGLEQIWDYQPAAITIVDRGPPHGTGFRNVDDASKQIRVAPQASGFAVAWFGEFSGAQQGFIGDTNVFMTSNQVVQEQGLVQIYADGSCDLYVDGVLVRSEAAGYLPTPSTIDFIYVSHSNATNDTIHGYISFSRLLTPEEIQQQFAQPYATVGAHMSLATSAAVGPIT